MREIGRIQEARPRLRNCPVQKPYLKKNYMKFIGIDITNNTKTRYKRMGRKRIRMSGIVYFEFLLGSAATLGLKPVPLVFFVIDF